MSRSLQPDSRGSISIAHTCRGHAWIDEECKLTELGRQYILSRRILGMVER